MQTLRLSHILEFFQNLDLPSIPIVLPSPIGIRSSIQRRKASINTYCEILNIHKDVGTISWDTKN